MATVLDLPFRKVRGIQVRTKKNRRNHMEMEIRFLCLHGNDVRLLARRLASMLAGRMDQASSGLPGDSGEGPKKEA